MEVTLENGRKITIPDALVAPFLPKRTGYERVEHGGAYLYATMLGNVTVDTEVGHCVDTERFDAANYYTDKQLALDNSRADTLMRRLRRYAAEHGGIPSVNERADVEVPKYSIFYRHDIRALCVSNWRFMEDAGWASFISQAACEAAIAEFHDDLIWYFTAYEGQVRENE